MNCQKDADYILLEFDSLIDRSMSDISNMLE